MGAPLRITVRELNVQGEVWNKNRKAPEKIKEQIINAFEKLKETATNKVPDVAEQSCRDTSFDMDVIVLTAVSDEQWEAIRTNREFNEYEWNVSNCCNRYSIVTGVKKSFDDFKIIEVISDRSTQDIDLLKVRFEATGQSFTVIGCRFTTGIGKEKLTVKSVAASEKCGYSTVKAIYRKREIEVTVMQEVCEKIKPKPRDVIYCELNKRENGRWVAPFGFTTKALKKQYDSECVAFCATLLPFIHKSIDDNPNDIFILAGDFNNAQCYGDLNSIGDYTYKEEGVMKERAQINYNLHLIKNWLEPYGFKMADITRDGKPIPTHKIYPIDHIFVKGVNLRVKQCVTGQADSQSDHAIILAEFDVLAE